jgi:hypothetical protein
MKALKPRARLSAEEALRAVASHAPSLPPVQLATQDKPTTLNLRMRQSTVSAITAEAKGRGLTIKQVVAEGLRAIGVQVAAADLEDRTPRRKDV